MSPPKHLRAVFLETLLFGIIIIGIALAPLRSVSPPIQTVFSGKVAGSRDTGRPVVTMVTLNTPHSYYFYQDQPMGFEYDLASAFADSIGAELQVRMAENWSDLIAALAETPSAFIAAGMVASKEQQDQVAFSAPYMGSTPHIVVHRDNDQIHHPEDLAGKTVHVRKGSTQEKSLEALKAGGINVSIVAREDVGTEGLLREVAEGIIDITVADTHTVLLNRRYYPQVVVQDPISMEGALGWGVSSGDPFLLARINEFFKTIQEDGRYQEIYDRYYADAPEFDFMDLKTYHLRIQSRLPRYQALIQDAADDQGFDWRLVAAQIYQESHFDPRAKGETGTLGMMQLTKTTAGYYQVGDVFNPLENIRAGVQYLKELYDSFPDAEPADRLAFALAAYNVGRAHVLDAQAIAKKQQLDPDKWASISETLPLLRRPEYYQKVPHGYCRGTLAVEYVKRTFLYYDILKHKEIALEQDARSKG